MASRLIIILLFKLLNILEENLKQYIFANEIFIFQFIKDINNREIIIVTLMYFNHEKYLYFK